MNAISSNTSLLPSVSSRDLRSMTRATWLVAQTNYGYVGIKFHTDTLGESWKVCAKFVSNFRFLSPKGADREDTMAFLFDGNSSIKNKMSQLSSFFFLKQRLPHLQRIFAELVHRLENCRCIYFLSLQKITVFLSFFKLAKN